MTWIIIANGIQESKLEDNKIMLIQYIRSYLPYLEAVSSIRNLRKRLAVVTRDPPNKDACA
jgi:hypothetical protein